MNNRNQLKSGRLSHFICLLMLSLLLVVSSTHVARAQWATNGTNINTTNTGNVGIGTTTPSEKLTIVGGNIMLSGPSAQQYSVSNPWDAGALLFKAGSTNGYFSSINVGGSSATSSGIQFITRSIERMRLDSATGNVGIGTSSPAYKLDVAGPINATGFYVNGSPLQTGGGSQWITNGTSVYYNNGNVGIGTTTPTDKLEVAGGIIGTYLKAQNTNTGVVLNATGGAVDQKTWAIQANINRNSLYFSAANDAGTFENLFMEAFRGTGTGFSRFHIYPTATFGSNVGIGTATPQAALDVVGNINVSGNINAKYQDVAEWVPALHAVSPGTVVILNPEKSNEVRASSSAYDTKVAGVISERPGLVLGEAGIGKVLVATTGRVKVKADASRTPIHVGDLLVTSSVEGCAMKSMPLNLGGVEIHRPGTLIGKALEPLDKGTGEILVLLSLQ